LLFFKTHIRPLQVAQSISMAFYKHIFLATTFILALSLSSNHASLAAHHLLDTPAVLTTANFVVSTRIPSDLPISSTLHPLPEVPTQPILTKPHWVPLPHHRRNQVATQLPTIPIIPLKLPTIHDATRTRAENRRRIYSAAIPSKRELTSSKYGWTNLIGLNHLFAGAIRTTWLQTLSGRGCDLTKRTSQLQTPLGRSFKWANRTTINKMTPERDVVLGVFRSWFVKFIFAIDCEM